MFLICLAEDFRVVSGIRQPNNEPRKNSLDQLPQPHQQDEQKESGKGSEVHR